MSRENSRRDLTNERTENRPRSRELTLEGSLIFRSCPSRQRLLQPLSRTRTPTRTRTRTRTRTPGTNATNRECKRRRDGESEITEMARRHARWKWRGHTPLRPPQVRRKDAARIRVVTIRNVKVTRFREKRIQRRILTSRRLLSSTRAIARLTV